MCSIKKNAAKCLACEDVIESTHRWDYVTCTCRKIAVDGGKDYLRRCYPSGNPELWLEELSEHESCDIEECWDKRGTEHASRG